jgi:integrase/recombinase XerC
MRLPERVAGALTRVHNGVPAPLGARRPVMLRPCPQGLLGEYERAMQVGGLGAATRATYLVALRRLDRELPAGLAGACLDELADAAFTPDRAPASRALYRAALRSFYAWAANPFDPRLDFDPARYLPAQRVPRNASRPVTSAVIADILARARKPYRTWYVLAAYAGLRCVEIAALQRSDVSAESIQVHGKGGHRRVVPTHPLVWAAVSALPAGAVARGRFGQDTTRRQVSIRGNGHLHHALGYRDVTMHRLRHYFGTQVFRACKDIRATQELLGHATIVTTQLYTQVAEEAKNAAVAALPAPAPRAQERR